MGVTESQAWQKLAGEHRDTLSDLSDASGPYSDVASKILGVMQSITSLRVAPYQESLPLVLGGMGPEAQLYYTKDILPQEFERLHKAMHPEVGFSDQHYPRLQAINVPFSDRTELLLRQDSQANSERIGLIAELGKAVAFMTSSETTEKPFVLVTTCNTVHYFMRALQGRVSVDPFNPILTSAFNLMPANVVFLDMVDLACASCVNVVGRQDGLESSVAVLATDGTNKTNLYYNDLLSKRLRPYVLPTDDERANIPLEHRESPQGKVMRAIYGRHGVKLAKGPEDRVLAIELFTAALDDVVANECRVALLACTELPVLMEDFVKFKPKVAQKRDDGTFVYSKDGRTSLVLVDPMRVIAKAQALHVYRAGPFQSVGEDSFSDSGRVSELLYPVL